MKPRPEYSCHRDEVGKGPDYKKEDDTYETDRKNSITSARTYRCCQPFPLDYCFFDWSRPGQRIYDSGKQSAGTDNSANELHCRRLSGVSSAGGP